jgi:hypothetical protein
LLTYHVQEEEGRKINHFKNHFQVTQHLIVFYFPQNFGRQMYTPSQGFSLFEIFEFMILIKNKVISFQEIRKTHRIHTRKEINNGKKSEK